MSAAGVVSPARSQWGVVARKSGGDTSAHYFICHGALRRTLCGNRFVQAMAGPPRPAAAAKRCVRCARILKGAAA